MAKIQDRHNPSWSLFPANNNRTAWRPFGLPILLVIPHVRDASGAGVPDSTVFNARISIEGAPNEALVAGHDHVGIRFPDRELFARSLSSSDLFDRKIALNTLQFFSPDGTEIDFSEAVEGDVFQYTTASGVTDRIEYLPDADYIDLSDIEIETEELPSNRYNLIYSTNFYTRVTMLGANGDQELVCINVNLVGLGALRFNLNHPGEVIDDVYRATPTVDLGAAKKSTDEMVAFYRPHTDMLQDIYDEQVFLQKANWVYEAPYVAIPYLAALLGWDIPYFPSSLDAMRRALLRKTVELQKLKGSRRAVIALLSIFGFDVLINNLYYSSDDKIFIGPGDQLPAPYTDQEITYVAKCQIDPLLSSYVTSGFGDLSIPLLFRPQMISGIDPFNAANDSGTVTIDAYLVSTGSEADLALAAVTAAIALDPAGYASGVSTEPDSNGFLAATPVHEAVAGKTLNGYAKILISDGVGTLAVLSGTELPLNQGSVSFNKTTNQLSLVFDHYLDLSSKSVYAFATYVKQTVPLPAPLVDGRSNRFDLQILDKGSTGGTSASPDVMDFLLTFIRRVKAFHSLLRVIRFRVDLDEVYQVTDLCVGGDITQRSDTAIGRQQVPPAIIPRAGDDCDSKTALGLGYKQADIDYRTAVLLGLAEELAAYLALNGRVPLESPFLLLPTPQPGPDSCQYTYRGQDRVIDAITSESGLETGPSQLANSGSASSQSNLELSPQRPNAQQDPNSDNDSSIYGTSMTDSSAVRQSFCSPDGRTDYCFKGRVADMLLVRQTMVLSEIYQNVPCLIGLGNGVYWTFPADGRYLANRMQAALLSQSYVVTQPALAMSWLGRLYRAYGIQVDETVYWDNRPYINDINPTKFLALQRPSLNIQKATLHLPGCRFPHLGCLPEDFVSELWRAKPFDNPVDEPLCFGGPTWLNAVLVPHDDGGTQLQYVDLPFTLIGNGLLPDLTSLDTDPPVPAGIAESAIVHEVYTSAIAPHPAITEDEVVIGSGTSVFETQIFNSAVPAGTGGWLDFVDGYPALTGYQEYDDLDLDRDGLYEELFTEMELPGLGTGTPSDPITSLFRLGSGVLVERGLRLDCGCLAASPTGQEEAHCGVNQYLNQEGELEFNSDQIWIEQRLVAPEVIGGSSWRLDGSIPSLMEIH